jgi:hypothetical protein
MKANEPVELDDVKAEAAKKFGAIPVEEVPEEPEGPSDDEIKEAIRGAIQAMLDGGEELGALGIPSVSKIKKSVPQVTAVLRDEVWESFFQPEPQV